MQRLSSTGKTVVFSNSLKNPQLRKRGMAQANGFTKLKDNNLNILLLFIGRRVNNFPLFSFDQT